MRPSRIWTRRDAGAATCSSWVTRRIDWPPACSRRNSSRTSNPPSESSAPVGSSASSRVGAFASARAMARRWRSPPESSPGAARALSARPRRSRRSTRPALRLPTAQAGDDGGERRVLEDGHPFQEVEELKDDADVATAHQREIVLVHAGQRLSGDDDLTIGWHVETCDEVQQRRLATARRSHDRDELPFAHRKVDSPQRAHRGTLGLIRLAHATCLHHAHRSTPAICAATFHAPTKPERPFTVDGAIGSAAIWSSNDWYVASERTVSPGSAHCWIR